MLYKVLDRVAATLDIPLYPAPARTFGSCAVYRWYPGQSDGVRSSGRLEIRVTAPHITDAAEKLELIRQAIVGEGTSGISDGCGGTLTVCRSNEGASSGYIRGSGLYYIKAGFDVNGRGEVNG